MKKSLIAGLVLLSILALAACGGSTAQTIGSIDSVAAGAATSAKAPQPAGNPALSEDYKDALPVVSQLILGSLKLDTNTGTGSTPGLAIDAGEAGDLLLLWQAYQSLSNSDNTATAELEALVDQIQETMRPDQVQAIAAMQLTSDDVGKVMQALGPGSFGGGPEGRGSDASGGTAAGGFAGPPPGDLGGPGGGPGGMPGGGPGGMPGGFADVSPEARETAIAERMTQDGGQAATFLTRGLLNQLITSLRIKTGDLTEAEVEAQQQQRTVMRWLPIASEATGISVDDLNAALVGGASLAEAILARGGDVAAVEAALREAIANNPGLDEQAIEKQVTSVLNTKMTSQ